MYESVPTATNWALHAATAGVVLFALGWAAVRRVGDPARRHRLAGGVVRAALLVAVLCALPAWLLLPLPASEPVPTPPVIESPRPVSVEEALPPVPAPEPLHQPLPRFGERMAFVVPVEVESGPPPEPSFATNRDSTPMVSGSDPQMVQPALPKAGLVAIQAPPVPPPSPWPEIAHLLLLAYAVGIAVAAYPLVVGALALARLRRHATSASPRVRAIFDELRGGLPVRVFVAPRLGSPVCFGLFRPVVVLPQELADATDAELRWVFAHELDHLRRGDPWTNWWVGLAKAIYFAVPWFWRVRHDLMLTQEYLADAAAAAVGRVEDYAAFLVRLSERPIGRRHPVGANAVRAGKSYLYRRVTMLLSTKDRSASRASRGWSIAVACATFGLAVVLSGIGFAQPEVPPLKAVTAPPLPITLDPLVNPAVAAPAPGRPFVVPVFGTAPFQALPVRHPAVRLIPAVVQPEPLLVPAPVLAPLTLPAEGAAVPFNPAHHQIKDQITLLQIRLDAALAANADDKDEQVKALKAQIEKLTKDLEKLQKDAAPPVAGGGGKRVVVGGLPGQGQGGVVVGGLPGQGGVTTWTQLGQGGAFSAEMRLGLLVDRVSPVLADQLDLPKGQGVVVSRVLKDTAAEKAGIKANDIVLEFAGKPAGDNPGDFIKAVNAVKVGDKVDVVVLRKGKKETIKGVEVPEAKKTTVVFPGDPNFPFNTVPGKPLNIVPPVPPLLPGGVRPPAVPVPPRPPIAGAGGTRSMQIQIDSDAFTIQANEDGVQYLIEGNNKDGKAVPSRITVSGDGETIKAQSIDKLPEKHKERVNKLMDSVKFGK